MAPSGSSMGAIGYGQGFLNLVPTPVAMAARGRSRERESDFTLPSIKPWSEVICRVESIHADSITLNCTKYVRVHCPSETIERWRRLLRIGGTVGILLSDNGRIGLRRIPKESSLRPRRGGAAGPALPHAPSRRKKGSSRGIPLNGLTTENGRRGVR